MTTKSKTIALAKERNIEIEITPITPYNRGMCYEHVHLYAPTGYYFKDHGTHNLSIWDAEPYNWRAIYKELRDNAQLAPCSDGGCNKECPTDDNED